MSADKQPKPRPRHRPHPDIQLYDSVEAEGENEVITHLDGALEFRVNGRVQPEERGTDARGTPQAPSETSLRIQRWRREREEQREDNRRAQEVRRRRPSRWLVGFGEGNRLLEYDRSHRRRRSLSFPPASRRAYYQAGDFILIATNSRNLMQRIYPELRADRDGYSFGDMLSDYVGISDNEVKIGYEIISIQTQNAETGEGRITLRPMLFIDAQTAVVFSNRPNISWNREELHRSFDQNLRWGALSSALTVGGAVVEVVTLPLGGGMRALGTRLARRLGRRFLARSSRRFRRAVLRIVLSKVRQMLTAFFSSMARSVAREVMRFRRLNRDRRQFGLEEVPLNWSRIITEAATNAALSVLGDAWARNATGQLRRWLNADSPAIREAYPRLNLSSPGELINHYIAEKIVGQMISAQRRFIQVLSQSLLNLEFGEQNQHNERSLSEEFGRVLRRSLSGEVSNGFQTAFVGGIGELFSGTQLE